MNKTELNQILNLIKRADMSDDDARAVIDALATQDAVVGIIAVLGRDVHDLAKRTLRNGGLTEKEMDTLAEGIAKEMARDACVFGASGIFWKELGRMADEHAHGKLVS